MPRKPRIEFAGACYHVMCRGNRQEPIFLDAYDRGLFLETLGEASARTGWIVHSFVLMTNHYHWLLETPEPNLSDGMRWFQGTYAQRFSIRHGLSGHVFQGRYKAPLISRDEPGYFRRVSDYIHLNPARAKMLDQTNPVLASYPWSSYPLFLLPPSKRPAWLEFSRVAGELGIYGDSSSLRRRYRNYLETRVKACVGGQVSRAQQEDWREIRRGWYLGSEAFRDALLERVEEVLSGKKRASFGGRILRAHEEKRARELIAACCEVLNLDLDRMRSLKKNDPRKQGIAWMVRSQTTMKSEWISSALTMGSRTSLYHAVKRFNQGSDRETQEVKRNLQKINRLTH